MQISASSTLTVYHDGQFWVGLAEHVEDGRYGVARIVFGAEPSDEEILQFVVNLNLPRLHCRTLRRLRTAIFRRPIGLLELRRAETTQ